MSVCKNRKPRKRGKQTIVRLRELCDELTDRDEGIKRDLKLFEEAFVNFPVPVVMWTINRDGLVLSKRGNAFTNEKAKTLSEMYRCEVLRDQSLEKHHEALGGSTVTYFTKFNGSTYYTRLIPRKDSSVVQGVIGVAWDVTSNMTMLECLESIQHHLEHGNYDAALADSKKAISASRLKIILEQAEL